ncbi:MAG: beta-N-acetylhexosaminidase [Bacteroides sp.]|nr:beta-N-acetylhexosaminidase [Bacteroides sp.]MCM1380074.1 beta-N-acetylhexosaminidase [Bacteroides sp.]MCM1446411.1 beta-N-acetylhexosaminidase [Prevotella sp.]
MLKKLFLVIMLLCGLAAQAETFINLTPAPKEMTLAEGEYKLPSKPTVAVKNLPDSMVAECEKFIAALTKATGLTARTVNKTKADFTVSVNPAIAPEGYTLNITKKGVAIEAATPAGLYFAFQTVKKLLPANVMAGVYEKKTYALPQLSITDEPRLEYRGFMLDCSRHFFTVDEIKRMLDVMSYYKMNKFHWHLTDDQGWRMEMPAYPRLQTVGATADNVQIVDRHTKTEYWLNKPYGPFYYTQDQMRDIVKYAAEHHIEVIPEVDMPGHTVAVMAAYPEFSCNPDAKHSVSVTGGIYADVLNVANPGAMQFVRDVCDALINIFPAKIIHIGGDECPDTNWVRIDGDGNIIGGNEECIALYKEMGMTHPRQLQSHFVKEVSDYVKSKGRRVAFWNEALTAKGTDVDKVRATDALIYCWVGADRAVDHATEMGLPVVYTPIGKTGPTKGSFYINRSQDPNDPPANGYKCDDVKSVYATIPFTEKAIAEHPELLEGVQGTFWTERVADREYLEYLALPRLLAIAEIGWTPQEGKNWDSFQKRMSADRELLDYNDYKYSPYHMEGYVAPTGAAAQMELPKKGVWYRVVSNAESPRGGRIWELGEDGVLTTTDKVAQKGDADYDAQWFQFVEAPGYPGRYAIVCKARPEGSVNGTPTSESREGRWTYLDNAKSSVFTFSNLHYGNNTDGTHWYGIHSNNSGNNQWMNASTAAQGFAVNIWNQPNDGSNSCYWTLVAEGGPDIINTPAMAMIW